MWARPYRVILVGVCVMLPLGGCSADIDDLFNDGPSGGGEGGGQGGAQGGENVGAGGAASGGAPSGGAPSDGGAGGSINTVTSTSDGGAPSGFCGDGVKDPGEDCDGADLAGASCADLGYTDPSGAQCDGQCHLDFSGCEPTCDGVAAEPDETCDGFDLVGMDCTDFGYENPAGLGCAGNCQDFDTSFCTAECGNGVLEPDEACDGSLVPASCTDFGYSNPTPGAPDCTFFCDVDSEPCLPTCGDGQLEPKEVCDDGNTANGDGCSSLCRSEGTDCNFPFPMNLGLGQQLFAGDTTTGGTTFDTTNPRCGAGAAGRSRTYAVNVLEDGFLTAWLDRPGTAFNSVLYARTTCDDDATTILCADNNPQLALNANGGELVSFPVEQGDTIFLIVDSASNAAQGAYSLTVDLSEGATCNDPVPLPVWSGTPMLVLGSTENQTQSTGGSCGGGGQGTGATDVVYQVDRRTATITNMTFALPPELTTYDSVLHGRFDCTGNEIDCDHQGGDGGEQISLGFQNLNLRYVWIDGFNGDAGPYGMVITPTP